MKDGCKFGDPTMDFDYGISCEAHSERDSVSKASLAHSSAP